MILLMGIAGSGKGTQGKLLGETGGYHVISTGELLRNYGSDDQHERMHKGIILGDEEVTELLDRALQDLADQDRTILDGYPRRVSQAAWLLADDKTGRFKVRYVLHLVASREAVKARLVERARTDDHDAAIEARFQEYEQATLPIIDYLRERGVPIEEIDAEQSIEVVQAQIKAIDDSYKQGGAIG